MLVLGGLKSRACFRGGAESGQEIQVLKAANECAAATCFPFSLQVPGRIVSASHRLLLASSSHKRHILRNRLRVQISNSHLSKTVITSRISPYSQAAT